MGEDVELIWRLRRLARRRGGRVAIIEDERGPRRPCDGDRWWPLLCGIATDPHHTLRELRASVGAQWTFLSDPGRIVQQDLDIQEYIDPENDPMIPHTLVLKPGLVVHRIDNGYWFWGRPSVVDLWHDLRAVTREMRPDWDLSTPGLRDAWHAGDLSPFQAGTSGPQQVRAPPDAGFRAGCGLRGRAPAPEGGRD